MSSKENQLPDIENMPAYERALMFKRMGEYLKNNFNEILGYIGKTISEATEEQKQMLLDLMNKTPEEIAADKKNTPNPFKEAWFSGSNHGKIFINPAWIAACQEVVSHYDEANLKMALDIQIVRRIRDDLIPASERDRFNYNPVLFPKKGEPVVYITPKDETLLHSIIAQNSDKFINHVKG